MAESGEQGDDRGCSKKLSGFHRGSFRRGSAFDSRLTMRFHRTSRDLFNFLLYSLLDFVKLLVVF